MPQAQLLQDDFSVGIVRGVGPDHIDPRAVRDHINGLYEDNGDCYKRGGSSVHSDQIRDAGLEPDDLDLGRLLRRWPAHRVPRAPTTSSSSTRTTTRRSTSARTDSTVPKPSVLSESMLFIGGGYIYGGSRKTANYTTGTVTVTTARRRDGLRDHLEHVGRRGDALPASADERVYVVASIDSTTQITLRDRL